MTEMPTLSSWLKQSISSLLSSSPGTHASPPPGGGGPGPLDNFDTIFDSIFAPNVEAVINDKTLDNKGLRAKMNAVQKTYNPETAKYSSSVEHDEKDGSGQVGLFFAWNVTPHTPGILGSGEWVQVSLNASIVHMNGAPIVKSLSLVSGAPHFII
ncbi:hypothetical protein SISNIDRAFT_470719 [Sistotremastrum niveocremeum HHB9708]|uniref:Uncharacterized protein n=1 Tax=Sistotremastrum niveocremeum HHB9708 TaxID=1314777 RepID=A0A164NGJ2_9AGAM|nr:hypothetical protein SISNIDRAFT_470719 [Sistotremastrum niveocremeum HHB9708]